MHELSICQALISQVEALARERNGRICQVRIGIGPLSGVEPQLLESAYPLACAGTGTEGSQLVIERMAIRVRCRSCGAETAAVANRLLCGSCGAWQTELVSGDELLLLSVDLETQEATEFAHV
jgi:hydrogenase nickel incorporation protein HypA/HybF